MMGHAEAVHPATLGLGLTDPTVLTEAVRHEEEDTGLAVEVVKDSTAALGM